MKGYKSMVQVKEKFKLLSDENILMRQIGIGIIQK